MRYVLFLCCFYFFHPSHSAQLNFLPGFVILHNNDTLHGTLGVPEKKTNPKSIQFLPAHTKDTISYSPWDIKAFLIHKDQTDHYYESHILKNGLSYTSASHKSSGTNHEEEGQAYFLYVYLKGRPYSLYFYQGKLSHFLLQKEDEPLHELPNQNAHNQSGKTLPMEKYKRQLFYFLADWPEATERIKNVQYHYRSLLKTFRDYNRFKEGADQEQYLQQEAPKHYQVGMMAGLSFTHISFSSAQKKYDYLSKGSADGSPSPALGLSIHLPLLRRIPSLSLYNELAYRSYKVRVEHTDHEDFWRPRTNSSFDVAYLRLSSMVRWRKTAARYTPFVQAGIWYSRTIKSENSSKTERYSRLQNVYLPYRTGSAIEEFHPFELGFSAGAGLSHRRLTAEIRLDLGNGMAKLTSLRANTYSAGIFLHYHFQ